MADDAPRTDHTILDDDNLDYEAAAYNDGVLVVKTEEDDVVLEARQVRELYDHLGQTASFFTDPHTDDIQCSQYSGNDFQAAVYTDGRLQLTVDFDGQIELDAEQTGNLYKFIDDNHTVFEAR